MREILLRGKSVQTDEWIEGSLIIDEKNNYYIGRAIIPKATVAFGVMPSRQNGKTLNRFIGIGFAMVIPETVGQFTGLTDRKGNRIYEGDIVKWDGTEISQIRYCDGVYRLCNAEGYYGVSVHNHYSYVEVIGNIHDNPELLKGA